MTTITGIVIPADQQKPLASHDLSTTSAGAYRQIIGGSFQLLNLDRPASSMYVNVSGKLDGLPLNPRATAILWAHNSAFRGADVLVGEVLLVGPVGPEGDDLSVPQELMDLLLGSGPFKVEVQVDSESGWHGNDERFDDVHTAYVAGVDLAQRWTKVREVRVVKDYTILIEQWLEIGRRIPSIDRADDPPFTRDSFARCSTLEELEAQLGSSSWPLGTAFYYRDLCLINQIHRGDQWLCIRSFTSQDTAPTSIAFESIGFGPLIERGDFASVIRRLLAASHQVCQRL